MSPNDEVMVTVRMTRASRELLKAEAKSLNRSLNDHCCKLLKVERFEKESPDACSRPDCGESYVNQ